MSFTRTHLNSTLPTFENSPTGSHHPFTVTESRCCQATQLPSFNTLHPRTSPICNCSTISRKLLHPKITTPCIQVLLESPPDSRPCEPQSSINDVTQGLAGPSPSSSCRSSPSKSQLLGCRLPVLLSRGRFLQQPRARPVTLGLRPAGWTTASAPYCPGRTLLGRPSRGTPGQSQAPEGCRVTESGRLRPPTDPGALAGLVAACAPPP
ncbi:hypothetical protein NN561_014492 [Cricetulus griseus]